MIEIRFFGQFGVKVGDASLQIPTHPAKLLFIYLVLHPYTPIRREKLAGLIWPDSPETQARSNLRHALWRLRKSCEGVQPETFQADDETICFDPPGDCWVDG
jgi:DNA-binding SARP family transcriptional activator